MGTCVVHRVTMRKKRDCQFHLRISREEFEALQRMADEFGESMASVVRRLIWEAYRKGEKRAA